MLRTQQPDPAPMVFSETAENNQGRQLGKRAEGGDLKPEEKQGDRKEAFRRRTKAYASSIIKFYCELPNRRPEVQILGRQLIRSGTSVAANYREASRARSTAEFISKTEQCAQEADETLLWLELLNEDCGIKSEILNFLLKETDELISIFVTMAKHAKRNE